MILILEIIHADDDLESGYLSPGSESSRSQTHRVKNVNNNIHVMEQKVRIKFEFKGEKR